MVHGKIRRAAWVLAAVLLLALGGCSRVESVQAQAGETVSTALFDFTVAEPQTLDAYPGIQIPDGRKLVTMLLTVSNTSDQTYTMFAGDFQIQWGGGAEDFGPCLAAVDDTMLPYGYELAPGASRSGAMLALVPADCTALTVAYQEQNAAGRRVAAYFVEVPL